MNNSQAGTSVPVIGEAVGFGFKAFGSNVLLLVGAMVLYYFAPSLLQAVMPSWLAIGLSFIYGLCLIGGFNRILLAIEEGSTAELGQLFSSVGLFLRYLIAQVLFIAMVVVGLILFVVPGLILITVFGLWPFLIVDLDLGPIEALNKSAEITRGHRWKLFGLYAVLLAVAVGLLIPLNLVTRPLAIPLQTGAGMSAQGAEIILTALNLIITYPILSLSWTKAYRQLLRAAEN